MLDEDREVVESQPGAVALDGTERSVPTDATTLAFRRWYRQHVHGVPSIQDARRARRARPSHRLAEI